MDAGDPELGKDNSDKFECPLECLLHKRAWKRNGDNKCMEMYSANASNNVIFYFNESNLMTGNPKDTHIL
jgi:hypothetical protein